MAKKKAAAGSRMVVVQAAPPARRRASAVVRRVAAGARRAAKRGVSAAQERQDDLVAMASAGSLAILEKRGTNLPTVGGLDVALVYGLASAFGAPLLLRGNAKMARLARASGVGLLCVGVHRSVARGSATVSGDYDLSD